MVLTSWRYALNGKIQKFDVSITKNYLREFEKYRIIQDGLFQSDFDKLIDGMNDDK